MKIDLSVVSFLKPHIINDKIYELSHQGFTKEKISKPDVIKNLEQHRRYKRFKGTYELRNNRNAVTTSNFP